MEAEDGFALKSLESIGKMLSLDIDELHYFQSKSTTQSLRNRSTGQPRRTRMARCSLDSQARFDIAMCRDLREGIVRARAETEPISPSEPIVTFSNSYPQNFHQLDALKEEPGNEEGEDEFMDYNAMTTPSKLDALERGYGRDRSVSKVTFSPVPVVVEYIPTTKEINESRQGEWGMAPFNDEYWDGTKRRFREVPLTPEELAHENSAVTRLLIKLGLGNLDSGLESWISYYASAFRNCCILVPASSGDLKAKDKSKVEAYGSNTCLQRWVTLVNSFWIETGVSKKVKSAFFTAAKS